MIATIFHSGMLYLGGLGLIVATKLAPIGAISLVASLILMIPLIANGLTEEE